ncbi:MAG: DUF2911 domain-containing protein [Chitinophagales bacterium]
MIKRLIPAIFVVITIFTIFPSCKNSSQDAIKEKRKDEMQNRENRVSPPAIAEATVGGNTVTVDYSSPRVKNRPIWGDLVPYNEVWRTGANEATKISFTKDVLIEGQSLTKDTYSLFSIPAPYPSEWTIIFNVNETQWGAFKYDQSEDALRVKVKSIPLDNIQENLVFEIVPDSTNNSGTVRMKWEKLQVDINFKNAE